MIKVATQRKSLLEAIIENAIDGIVYIGSKGVIKFANPALCRIFGYGPDELTGRNISLIIRDEAVVSRAVGCDLEVIGIKKDGGDVPVRMALSKINGDNDAAFCGIIRDMSQQKVAEESMKQYTAHLEEMVRKRTLKLETGVSELQQARQAAAQALEREIRANEMKTKFVAMASHEFRTPLSRIQLSASLIGHYYDRLDLEKITGHTKKIREAVADLTGILTDFLSVEQIESGYIVPVNETFAVVPFCYQIVEEMQPFTADDQVLVFEPEEPGPVIIQDKKLLKRCITNLLSNAFKYAPGGRICLSISTAGNKCLVCVSDTGIGISAENQLHIFKPFYRAGNTGEIPGTGLGLYILKKYVQLMGGEITFKSHQGKGSVFTLELPLQADDGHDAM